MSMYSTGRRRVMFEVATEQTKSCLPCRRQGKIVYPYGDYLCGRWYLHCLRCRQQVEGSQPGIAVDEWNKANTKSKKL